VHTSLGWTEPKFGALWLLTGISNLVHFLAHPITLLPSKQRPCHHSRPQRNQRGSDGSFLHAPKPYKRKRRTAKVSPVQVLWVPLSNCVASQQSKLKFEPTPTFVASLRGYQSVVLDIRQRGSSRIGEVIPRPDCLHPFPVGEDWFVAHTLMNFARRKIRSPYLHGYEPLAQVWR
jgi:hypothetical protein